MFNDPRISQKELASLCRRLGTALEAGIDIRRVWEREGQGYGSLTLKARMLRVSDELIRGSSLTEALQTTGEYFPSLFRELVAVGEQTGNLAEVFLNLADHYEHQIQIRRAFLSSITWPLFQLAAALGVIGIVIVVMDFLPARPGEKIDILGFGLTGMSGLVIYLCFLAAVAAAVGFVVRAMQRGLLWTRPLQRLLLRIPVFGRFLQILALSRLAWTMHLTLNTSLDLRRALPLCLRSTQNAHYIDQTERIVDAAVSGQELCQSFAATGVFPGDFLDALEVGERTGQLPESMARLAEDYRDQAKRMMHMLAVAGGFAVAALVGLMIIGVIFMMLSRTLFPYYRLLHELTQ
jgi:type II secretory pathway component PulF